MTFDMIDERHLRAMEEIGKRRTHALVWSFVLAHSIVFGVAVATGFRVTLGLIAGIGIGGVVSRFYADSRKHAIVRDVCLEHRLDPAELDADKYLLDQGPKL